MNQFYNIVEKKDVADINVAYVFISLQCGRQIAQLKEEYEESKKTLEAEASKLRQVRNDDWWDGERAFTEKTNGAECSRLQMCEVPATASKKKQW